MEHTRRTPGGKPYDIRERLFLFARDVVAAAQKLQTRGGVADSLSRHLAEAVVSAAANAEEADDASSNKDFRAKQRICLRELKETRLRLRVSGIWDLGSGIGDRDRGSGIGGSGIGDRGTIWD
jgi:four helix bundle protein